MFLLFAIREPVISVTILGSHGGSASTVFFYVTTCSLVEEANILLDP
jgi:hypothetical protein